LQTHGLRKLQPTIDGLLPHVIDIRNIGLLAAIDLTRVPERPAPRGAECANRCFEDGILIRASGDTLLLSPPLIITEEQIETTFAAVQRALREID
jgi:beta-alanine--pyruvate transaminase